MEGVVFFWLVVDRPLHLADANADRIPLANLCGSLSPLLRTDRTLPSILTLTLTLTVTLTLTLTLTLSLALTTTRTMFLSIALTPSLSLTLTLTLTLT